MAFLQSPGVQTQEQSFVTSLAPTAGTTGAFVGAFEWGPADQPYFITGGEKEVTEVFGLPKSGYNRKDWFSLYSFLKYSSAAWVVRVVGTGALNAVADAAGTITASTTVVKNKDEFDFSFTNPDNADIIGRYPGDLANGIEVEVITAASFGTATYASLFDAAPYDSTNGVHVVIAKNGEVLEKWADLSNLPGAIADDGTNAYYIDVVNENSKYVYIINDISGKKLTLSYGALGTHPGDSVVSGWELLKNKESYDISLLVAGPVSNTVNAKVLEVAEYRKDCTAYVSPQFAGIIVGGSTAATNAINDRVAIGSSSYGFMDSNWGLMFDHYNKKDVWIPMCGVSAGLTAKTEKEADAWFAPAGYNRGRILGFKRLAWEQDQAIRDLLYKNQVNPITTFKPDGMILFGNRTMQGKPGPFQKLNIRRLFILLETTIEKSAKYFLFEQHTPILWLRIKNMIVPFLRLIQARQGIEKFEVIVDERNNPPSVRERGELYVDVMIVPVYSAEMITLKFAAMPGGTAFDEIISKLYQQ